MYVVKRDGQHEEVAFDKITERIRKLCYGLNRDWVDPAVVAQKVVRGLYNGVKTSEIDELSAETAAHMSIHPDYGLLAGRLIVSNLHSAVPASYRDVCERLYHFVEPRSQQHAPCISKELYDIVQQHADEIQAQLDFSRDLELDFFSIRTLLRSYLLRADGNRVAERPQHMWMRVALGIHSTDLLRAFETYHYMSNRYMTHATPTLFNAGTPHPTMSSCFLTHVGDSIEDIFSTIKDCATISKGAGGIGMDISSVRAQGSYIRGTCGYSNGVVPMLRVMNNTARYVDQCWAFGTTVWTPRGWVPIQSVVRGDRLYTRGGRLGTVSAVMHTKLPASSELYRIETSDGQSASVTGAHLVLVLHDQARADPDVLSARLEHGTVAPVYVPVHDVTERDMLLSPRLRDFPETALYTSDTCYVLGLLYSSGNVHQGQAWVQASNVGVIRWLAERYVPPSRTVSVTRNRIAWRLDPADPITKALVNNQHPLHESLLRQPREATRALLSGLINGGQMCSPVYQAALALSQRLGLPRIPRSTEELKGWYEEEHKGFWARWRPVMLKYKPVRFSARHDTWVADLKMSTGDDPSYVTNTGTAHNGGGKRKGAFAVYLEPWHADIMDFLQLRKNHGVEEERARDLYYGLWVPDLFMQRVEQNATWSLMCPNQCPGLQDAHSDEFQTLYESYEAQGKFVRQIPAQTLWREICEVQKETGMPYMLYKDTVNRLSNQKNLGTIRSSNLCTEIVEFTSPDEIASCNLASVALQRLVDPLVGTFDFDKLYRIVGVVTRNLNLVIDRNMYPLERARVPNLKHRPIGIGVQGLADVFLRLRLAFDSPQARRLNRQIFETMYFAAVDASCRLAEEVGQPYASFSGSPLSQGIFHWEMWPTKVELSGRWDWDALRQRVLTHGVRNSLFIAPMPTASTAQILGSSEGISPLNQNMFVRRTLSGEFVVLNRYLVEDLIERQLWSHAMKDRLVATQGSVQTWKDVLSMGTRHLYRTVWEMPQRTVVDIAADRAPFVDQSQSLNIHMVNASYAKITSLHFHAWRQSLKTGMYYLRTQALVDPLQVTVQTTDDKKVSSSTMTQSPTAAAVCTMDDGCLSCGS